MTIIINGEETEERDGATITDLLLRFDLSPERVAVEVNEQLVRRAGFPEMRLVEGDHVEIVTLVGGG
jgi:thiamine biosynthesis protein ThiS